MQEVYLVGDLESINSGLEKWNKEEKEANQGRASKIASHHHEFIWAQSCWGTLGDNAEHTTKSYPNIYQFPQLLVEGCYQRVLISCHFQTSMCWAWTERTSAALEKALQHSDADTCNWKQASRHGSDKNWGL